MPQSISAVSARRGSDAPRRTFVGEVVISSAPSFPVANLSDILAVTSSSAVGLAYCLSPSWFSVRPPAPTLRVQLFQIRDAASSDSGLFLRRSALRATALGTGFVFSGSTLLTCLTASCYFQLTAMINAMWCVGHKLTAILFLLAFEGTNSVVRQPRRSCVDGIRNRWKSVQHIPRA